MASISIPGGRSLRTVKNRGGSFDKVVDQNLPSYFYWVKYTLNKTFYLEGKEAQNGGRNQKMRGNLSPKLGESCARF